MSISEVLRRIERLRRKMNVLADRRGRDHNNVLRVSRILDKRLNQYHRMKYTGEEYIELHIVKKEKISTIYCVASRKFLLNVELQFLSTI